MLYFKALGNILLRDNRCLTELYLIVQDYDLEDRWNEIAPAFADNHALSEYVQSFIDGIPYPSDKEISQQAMLLALQTIFRTNYLEGKEVSMLPAETETLVRLFIVGDCDEKRFNEMIKAASESKRKTDLMTCYNLMERLPRDTMYREQISDGLGKIIEDLEQDAQKRKRSFTGAIAENAEKIRDNAGRFVANLKKNSKNESLVLPEKYQKLKQKFPEETGIPKNAVVYGMRTDAASGLLISFPVSEEDAMPFDDPQSVIDEQHNFGVEQRVVLLQKCGGADTLMMSATPIPRTMIMALYGDIQVSRITQKPANRLPIETKVLSFEEKYDKLVEAIKRKVDANEKVYWVCPLVEESEKLDYVDKIKEKFGL